MVTPWIRPALHQLYNDDPAHHHKAILVVMMRHPVERTISLFYYLQQAVWEPTYSIHLNNMTLLQYIDDSNRMESNWMTRQLTGKLEEPLLPEDLQYAQWILERYAWVGLVTEMEESLQRFGQVLGWPKKKQQCETLLPQKSSNTFPHPTHDRQSIEWQRIEELNYWDVQLYHFAVGLFQFQGEHDFAAIAKQQRQRKTKRLNAY